MPVSPARPLRAAMAAVPAAKRQRVADPSVAASRLCAATPTRSPVLLPKAAVACSQPLAAEAGVAVLKRGGTAVDAAVAVAAALAVVEPCSTGVGGDAFLLYYDAKERTVHAANGSGRAPAALTPARIRADLRVPADAAAIPGEHAMHAHCVTVPGCVRLWCDAVRKWGSGLPLSDVLARAAELADAGFPVAPVCAEGWAASEGRLRDATGNAAEVLVGDPAAEGGLRAPRAGETWRNPGLAALLRRVGAEGADAFYRGACAEAIAAEVAAHGGVLSTDDLRDHTSTWPDAVSTEYAGVRVWEHPPNGQGITALVALNILTELEARGAVGFGPGTFGTTAHLHAQIEALRLAFADARHYVCDPDVGKVPVAGLLDSKYARQRADGVDMARAAADVVHGQPPSDCHTVSFQVVDAAGNAVSMVNSTYMGFGTGLVPKGFGFTLQNRGHNFSLRDGDPNCLAPRKRPYHTIIPCITTHGDGTLHATFTNMGGFMQPQGHVQHLINMLKCGMEPQTSIDAPRFCILNDAYSGMSGLIGIETGFDEGTIEELRRMGHNMQVLTGAKRRDVFGRAQIIVRLRSGALWAGSDGRADGCAIGY